MSILDNLIGYILFYLNMLLSHINNLKPHVVERMSDIWVWTSNVTGIYTTKITYKWLKWSAKFVLGMDLEVVG